jgi:hypothetical protein
MNINICNQTLRSERDSRVYGKRKGSDGDRGLGTGLLVPLFHSVRIEPPGRVSPEPTNLAFHRVDKCGILAWESCFRHGGDIPLWTGQNVKRPKHARYTISTMQVPQPRWL